MTEMSKNLEKSDECDEYNESDKGENLKRRKVKFL